MNKNIKSSQVAGILMVRPEDSSVYFSHQAADFILRIDKGFPKPDSAFVLPLNDHALALPAYLGSYKSISSCFGLEVALRDYRLTRRPFENGTRLFSIPLMKPTICSVSYLAKERDALFSGFCTLIPKNGLTIAVTKCDTFNLRTEAERDEMVHLILRDFNALLEKHPQKKRLPCASILSYLTGKGGAFCG